MNVSFREGVRVLLAFALTVTAGIVAAPRFIPETKRGDSFVPPSWLPAGQRRSPATSEPAERYVLGTDYLGRSFTVVLCRSLSATARIALLGTLVAVLCCIVAGTLHGSTRSRGMEAMARAGTLGLMAVPEAAALITLAAAWPRTAPAAWVNSSMIAVLVLFAVPTGARLIADRVRAVQRSGFVAASRACGASYAYTFRHEVWPHLIEDVAWLTSSILPRFVAVEVGLAYLGVEYRDFEGLGRALTKSFNNLNDRTAAFQLLVTIAVILWVALLPQITLRLLGIRARLEAAR